MTKRLSDDQSVAERFFLSCIDGDLDAVRTFIQAGVDLNAHESSGLTALSGAVFWQKPNVVDLLLASGADASADGSEALVTAIDEVMIDCARKLLLHGADPDVVDDTTRLIEFPELGQLIRAAKIVKAHKLPRQLIDRLVETPELMALRPEELRQLCGQLVASQQKPLTKTI